MKVDYIIVGLGLAGLAFSRELDKNNKTYVIFDDSSQNSSLVAGGMYNPIILKRFTPVWEAKNQLAIALPFYKELEEQFHNKYDYKIDIYRIFKSVEEQNNWFIACDHPQLNEYLSSEIIHEKFEGIKADFGFGRITGTGRIATNELLSDYKKYLQKKKVLKTENFDYAQLQIFDSSVSYKNITASKVVFCEGFGLEKNPFFNTLPMNAAKGEVLTIHSSKLKVDFLIKAPVFVLPLENNTFRVGATFNWIDKTLLPTEEGKNELLEKLNSFITVPYEVIEHKAGIRPTIKDRRPLVGKHTKYQNLAILNGLGTRGVMIAPLAAKMLYNNLENNLEINSEYAVSRFY